MDLQRGKTRAVRLCPVDPLTGPCTASVLDRAGTSLETPTATPDATSTTITAATTAYEVTVGTIGTIARGRKYRVTAANIGACDVEVELVTGTVVRFLDPLPEVPTVSGSAFVGLEVAVTVGTDSTAELSLHNRLVVTDANSVETQLVFNVVETPFVGPVRGSDVRAWMARHWQGERVTDGWCRVVAQTSNERLRARLLETDNYLSSYWDPTAVEPIGALMMQQVLMQKFGFGHPRMDPDTYSRSLALDLRDRLGGLIRGASPSDVDRDGVISTDETAARPTLRFVR